MMKLMNSETHSWTVSLASLDILAFAGSDFFMIRLTLAMGRNRSSSLEELSEMFPDEGLPSGLVWFLFLVMVMEKMRVCCGGKERRGFVSFLFFF